LLFSPQGPFFPAWLERLKYRSFALDSGRILIRDPVSPYPKHDQILDARLGLGRISASNVGKIALRLDCSIAGAS
jgi:hypothetical protein